MNNKRYPSHPVLIVDDEKNSLLSTNVALSTSGINNIVTCQDSCKVEGLLSQNQFSAIILDMMMPGISGLDLCPMIIKMHPDLPVIILTGIDDVEPAVNCMKTGVFDYLTKPVSLSRLIESTKHAIEFGGVKRENRMLKEYLLSDYSENMDTLKLENTSKNQVFQLLKKTRMEYKSLFKNIPIPFFISNLKTSTIEHCNTAFAEFMGFRDCNEVLENKEFFLDYCNLNKKDSLVKYLKTSGIIQNLEITGRKRDGIEFCILLNCRLLKDKQYTECSFIDITERKAAEKTLSETETKFRLLFQQSPEAQIILRKTRFKDCNDAAIKMFRCSNNEQFLNMSPWYFAPAIQKDEEFFAGGRKRITDAVLKGMHIKFECKLRRYDSENFPAEIALTPILMDRKKFVYCVVRDLTDQKLLEEQLRQSQKMEAMGRLSGGIAHDFNNLLTAIIGYSELIISKRSLDKNVYSHVEEIKKAGKRAASLTQQLLAFSRKQILQAKEIDLNKQVADIDKILRRLIGEDITLTTKLEPNLGIIKADPGQIEQVIMNLAVNARDAMPRGGNLTIETGNIHIDQDIAHHSILVKPGPHIMLAMSDTGVGMDKNTKDHMFDPFFTTKEMDKGTGLGLSTVYGIIEQSGGSIQVDSAPGKGTTFKVYFPLIANIEEKLEQLGESSSPGKGKETILLVEDEETLKNLLSTVLDGYGYRVLEAENGYKAIKISGKTEKIDLMITDIVMPNVSGPELAKDILKSHPMTKVLYISGYMDDKLGDHGLLGSGIHFLQKPFTPGNLAQKVREMLDN